LDKVGKLASQKSNNNDNNNDIQFKSQIEESMSVADTMVDYAENQNIDLIVVGSRGRSSSSNIGM